MRYDFYAWIAEAHSLVPPGWAGGNPFLLEEQLQAAAKGLTPAEVNNRRPQADTIERLRQVYPLGSISASPSCDAEGANTLRDLVCLPRCGLLAPEIAAGTLPPLCWLLQAQVQLTRPFFSKDGGLNRVMDNSLFRDLLSRRPEVRSSSWKGATRRAGQVWANELADKAKQSAAHKRIARLWGPEEGDEEGETPAKSQTLEPMRRRGRLLFFPSFFECDPGFEVITRLDETRRAPAKQGPITFEVVPAEATTDVWIGYLPVDILSEVRKGKPAAGFVKEAIRDLDVTVWALRNTLMRFGVGAKTSSGWGRGRPLQIKGWVSKPGGVIALESGTEGDVTKSFRLKLLSVKEQWHV